MVDDYRCLTQAICMAGVFEVCVIRTDTNRQGLPEIITRDVLGHSPKFSQHTRWGVVGDKLKSPLE